MMPDDMRMVSLEQFTQPMRDELTRIGFSELRSPAEVDAVLGEAKGTVLLFINSVCGCAGGIARPAAALALQAGPMPNHLVTVFAGQDKEATACAREAIKGYPPSSPSMALFKDGKVVRMIERHEIEGHDPRSVAAELQRALVEHCGA